MLKLILIFLLLHGIQLYSQSLEYARNIVNILASEEYMGRGYCGKADLKSARFIRNEFRMQGLQAFEDKYFQFFKLNINTFPGKMEVKLKGNILIPGMDYLVDPASPSLKGKFNVVRINRTDITNEETLKHIFDRSTGKAILIDMTDTIRFNAEAEESINKVINAIKYDRGIKNSLTIIFTDKKLSWSISDWQAKKPIIILNLPGSDPSEITEIEVNIKASYKENYQTQNVIGLVRGRINPDSFLVVTAHYDHLGIMGKKTTFPGANDNASGVAMLLNLSKYFAANPPEYSMVFLALAAEEVGLLGAQYFIQNPLFKTNKIKFLVNFDLAGTGEEGIKVVNATVFKTEFEKLLQINDQYKYLPSIEPRGEACISDHCVFYLSKVPCFYIYTLGGISAYHDIFDKAGTLPLSEFYDYYQLMISFFTNLPDHDPNP